jgi:hypothetical protein
MDLVAAILFIITGVLHVTIPMRFGNTAGTRPIAAFGVIYLVLGVLILLETFSWTPIVALILTLIGGTGAATQINTNPELRPWNLLFIGIDVVIVVLLVISLIVG